MRKRSPNGLLSLLLVSGFLIYQNRESIARYLKNAGIDLKIPEPSQPAKKPLKSV